MKDNVESFSKICQWRRVFSVIIFISLPLLSHQLSATELSNWNRLLNFDLLVTNEGAHKVQQFDANEGTLTDFINNVQLLRSPRGIAVGPDGIIYIGSFLDEKILAFDSDGTWLQEWSLPDGWRPSGLTFGHDGDLYIASLNFNSISVDGDGGVFSFDPENENFELIVSEGSGGLTDPWGIVLGPDKKIYVASKANHRVLRYKSTGSFDKVFVDGDNLIELRGPRGLTFGPDAHLYVSSSNNDTILRFDGKTGEFLGLFTCNGCTNLPIDLTFGANGDLYVSSAGGGTDSISQFDGETGSFVQSVSSSGPTFMAHKAPYIYGCILIQGSAPVAWTAKANKGMENSSIDNKGCFEIPVVRNGWNLRITLK